MLCLLLYKLKRGVCRVKEGRGFGWIWNSQRN